MDEVCRRVYEKMVRRHPHVFGGEKYADSQELLKNWEDLKAAEKAAAGVEHKRSALMDGIPEKLPATYRTYQISSKAARVGFDWENLSQIRDKLLEEFSEVESAARGGSADQLKDEVGDLLFAAVNVARFLQIDPDTALNRANSKFIERFKGIERHFSGQRRALKDVDVEEMEAVWQKLKGAKEWRVEE